MANLPRLPAEWEPQAALMLTWPRPNGDWGETFDAAEQATTHLAATVSRYQPLIVTVPDDAVARTLPDRIAAAGGNSRQLHCYVAPANDIWARDHGPVTVMSSDGGRQLVDFTFNGWGGKHAASADNALTETLHRLGAFGRVERRVVDAVLEGGAVETEGHGTLLTTSECLLHPGRNPGRDRAWYEALFQQELGIQRVLWLDHGWLAGDDTDGHVDMLARFADPHTIAHVACDDPSDPHYTPLEHLRQELQALTRADGRAYRLVALPWPEPVISGDGRRLPATYANFLIINGAVLVPAYGVPQDEAARLCLADLFPDRHVLSLDARVLIGQGGALHCAAMQVPEQA